MGKPCPWDFELMERETIAMAPVAPEIIPGAPPNREVVKHMIQAAWSATLGGTSPSIEKAVASGIIARETVRPVKTWAR